MIIQGDIMKKQSVFYDDTGVGVVRRLFALFFLNVSDWICTLALIKTGLFKEANPLMSTVVSNIYLGFFVKVCVPLTLIFFAFSNIKNADSHQLRISNSIVLAGTAIYFLLNLYHIVCFILADHILH